MVASAELLLPIIGQFRIDFRMVSYFERHITGQGRFVDDLPSEGAARMVILRAPIAHGHIRSLDVSVAKEMPGVLDVITCDDLDGIGPLRSTAPVTSDDGAPMCEPDRPVLANGKVVYLGQPVAAVIATDMSSAMDALEAIDLDLEDIAPVLDPAKAQAAPPIWDGIDNNLAFHWSKGRIAETEAAFNDADHIVTIAIKHPRVSVAPVETRGCLASYADGVFTLSTGSQGVMSIRREVAACLDIGENQFRVVTPDVGGSFAVKIWAYPEHVLALFAARKIGRDVRWLASRSESLACDAAGRGRVDQGALAFDKSGTLLGFRIDAIADMGAFLNAVAPYIATGGAVRPFGQCYDIPAMSYSVKAVYTNAPPTDAYRGAGKPESAATLERLIDLAAAKLGMDPFDLRARNLITPDQLPYLTSMGETYDGGDFPMLSEKLRHASDWAGYAARQKASAQKGMLRGRGIGFHLHATGGSTTEKTYVTARADGRFVVRTGTQDSGQGQREALAQIAADTLEVPSDRIDVEQGDSERLDVGGGTGGSCLMAIAGNNLHLAARELIENSKSVAADHLEAAHADIEYTKGNFQVIGTDRKVSWGELTAEDGDAPSCAVAKDFEGIHTTFPNGGYVVEVELDPDTGAVEIDRFIGISDIGRVISLEGALGQLRGGIAQAIGEVMLEELIHSDDGQLLTGSLMDYCLPKADDIPDLKIEMLETDSPNSELGVKGVGELSSIGAPAVVMNAIIDAAGVDHIDKPITPQKIWVALNQSK